jgi:hypothetical protein
MAKWIGALLVVMLLGVPAVGVVVQVASGSDPVAPGGPDLKTTLEKGLRARRPVEFAFIAQVMELVDDGTLPRSVVESTFLWARKKRPYPYPFFEQGLKERAKKLGISL